MVRHVRENLEKSKEDEEELNVFGDGRKQEGKGKKKKEEGWSVNLSQVNRETIVRRRKKRSEKRKVTMKWTALEGKKTRRSERKG